VTDAVMKEQLSLTAADPGPECISGPLLGLPEPDSRRTPHGAAESASSDPQLVRSQPADAQLVQAACCLAQRQSAAWTA